MKNDLGHYEPHCIICGSIVEEGATTAHVCLDCEEHVEF